MIAMKAVSSSLLVALPNLSLATKPTVYDQPNTWTKFGFTGPVSVGTPAQNMDIVMDWTWISAYVWTGKCYHHPNTPHDC